MPAFLKLKKRKDFVRIAKSGHSFPTHTVVLQAGANPDANQACLPRIGYTTTKKIGTAVVRNRCRRRLRAAAALILPTAALLHTDYVLIARYNTPDADFRTICKDLKYGLKKINQKFNGENSDDLQTDKPTAVSVAD